MLSSAVLQINEKRFPGDFGVDLFFVVSGFMMVCMSRDTFAQEGAAMDFLRRRGIRIVPLCWLITSLMIAVVVVLPHRVRTATSDAGQWISSYVLAPHA
jgi:peptidoglycan/LPS O-acetylase OafA/YrhL